MVKILTTTVNMDSNNWNKDTYKKFKCCFCNYRPTDINDLTFGEFSPDNKTWACFDHTHRLWKLYDPKIENQSQYWDFTEKKFGKSPRPH